MNRRAGDYRGKDRMGLVGGGGEVVADLVLWGLCPCLFS